jgi:hypothetical protein
MDLQIGEGDAVAASGTFAFASVADSNAMVVQTTTMTAKTTPSGIAEFAVGATDDDTRDNAIAKINAHTTLKNYVVASIGGVKASGTLTLSAVADGDTAVVNGVTFTFRTSLTGANVIPIGGSDDQAAKNLANFINSSANVLIAGLMTAARTSSGVVTITAVTAGVKGNGYTIVGGSHITASAATLGSGTALVKITALYKGILGNCIALTGGTNITRSGAYLTGGTEATAVPYSYGA